MSTLYLNKPVNINKAILLGAARFQFSVVVFGDQISRNLQINRSQMQKLIDEIYEKSRTETPKLRGMVHVLGHVRYMYMLRPVPRFRQRHILPTTQYMKKGADKRRVR